MAFLKTIQIVLVVIASGVISSESHQPPPPNNMCYKERPSLYGPAALRYQHTMVDATGQKCYKTLSNRQMTTMLAKTWLNELSANASAEVQ
ncbi:unnamed protein product [Allacma fusca]|uniref:Secreted protein n=1 Tax=Allacma fusca TaxID=39272 RepID=A0A8J2L1I5_9HEXA|nr:unnamed protein product [Allacma fusca]